MQSLLNVIKTGQLHLSYFTYPSGKGSGFPIQDPTFKSVAWLQYLDFWLWYQCYTETSTQFLVYVCSK